jgi:hypothetical protein
MTIKVPNNNIWITSGGWWDPTRAQADAITESTELVYIPEIDVSTDTVSYREMRLQWLVDYNGYQTQPQQQYETIWQGVLADPRWSRGVDENRAVLGTVLYQGVNYIICPYVRRVSIELLALGPAVNTWLNPETYARAGYVAFGQDLRDLSTGAVEGIQWLNFKRTVQTVPNLSAFNPYGVNIYLPDGCIGIANCYPAAFPPPLLVQDGNADYPSVTHFPYATFPAA